MLFNFIFNTDISQGTKEVDIIDIDIKTVQADSIDEAIYIYVLGDNVHVHYIENLIGHAATKWRHPDREMEELAKMLYKKFDIDLNEDDLTDVEYEERYKQIIDENLDEIAELIGSLQPFSKFFRIDSVDNILTGPMLKSVTKR